MNHKDNGTENPKPGAASFERRRFSIGIFSTATVLAVIGVFVVVNLFVGSLNWSVDLTRDQRFSISSYTRDFLRELDEPVTIYTLFRQGSEILAIQEMLNQYASASNNVRIVNRDPYIYWQFVSRFAADEPNGIILSNSIIVESEQRHRVVHVQEMETITPDWEHFHQTGEWVPIHSFDLEALVTNAINFVTQEAQLVAYELIGNGQAQLSPSMELFLRDAGYELRQHNIIHGEIPETSDILIITTPQRDFTPAEADTLRNHLLGGGAAIFLVGHTTTPLLNFLSVIERFGVTIFNEYRLHDRDSSHHRHPSTLDLLPSMTGHPINLRMADDARNRLSLPLSAVVQADMNLLPPNIRIQTFLTTSDHAIIETPQGSPGDTGLFALGVGILYEFPVLSPPDSPIQQHGLTRVSRIAVIGNHLMVHDDLFDFLNRRYVVETMNWAINRTEGTVFIPRRVTQGPPAIIVDTGEANIIKAFAYGIFPAVIVGAGVGVWLKRRNS